MPDGHSLDIEIFGQYAQIYDAVQVDLSELHDAHNLARIGEEPFYFQ